MMRFSSQGPMIPGNPNVVSAAPQLINREGDIQPPGEEQPKSSATIEAKAKIRYGIFPPCMTYTFLCLTGVFV